METQEKKVSIIIPIYNYYEKLFGTLESIFNSTYKNIEVIIVNDGSTDPEVQNILDIFSKRFSEIQIYYKDNGGPGSARNYGIQKSSGDYILPLDADDKILPTYIQKCVEILNKNEKISPVYCDTIHMGQQNFTEKRPDWSVKQILNGPFIVNCSMFHRKAYDVCGGYDETMIGWEDYELWVHMMKNGYSGFRIAEPLFIYFHHEKDGTVSTVANNNQSQLYTYIMNKHFQKNNK